MGQGYEQYAGADEGVAFDLLESLEYGHLHVWMPEHYRTAITFMHFVLDRTQGEIIGHLANSNPVLERMARDPRATFVVYGPAAYVPSTWGEGDYAVPTSYYSWAQFDLEVVQVTDPESNIRILQQMLARFQPEGGHPELALDDSGWQRMVGVITGLRMKITAARSRHKYGQNKSALVREGIAACLEERGLRDDSGTAAAVRALLAPSIGISGA